MLPGTIEIYATGPSPYLSPQAGRVGGQRSRDIPQIDAYRSLRDYLHGPPLIFGGLNSTDTPLLCCQGFELAEEILEYRVPVDKADIAHQRPALVDAPGHLAGYDRVASRTEGVQDSSSR